MTQRRRILNAVKRTILPDGAVFYGSPSLRLRRFAGQEADEKVFLVDKELVEKVHQSKGKLTYRESKSGHLEAIARVKGVDKPTKV